MKIAYLECFSGISGDMFLGALVDAGVSPALLEQTVAGLNLGATLRIGKVNRSGISATKVDVLVAGQPAEHSHEHSHSHTHEHAHEHSDGSQTKSVVIPTVAPELAEGSERRVRLERAGASSAAPNGDLHFPQPAHSHSHDRTHTHDNGHTHSHGRSLAVIQQLIQNSTIAPAAKELALKAFNALGQSEAKIHNVPVERIHFHEVGAVDAIADIVATAVGCVSLGIDQWYCSALNVGSGSVECAHGAFPVPAPATLDLLRDAPIYSAGPKKELVTPTGAALLRALAVSFDPAPTMRPTATGYGAGTRDFPDFPNVARLTLGEAVPAPQHQFSPSPRINAAQNPSELIGIIETTIDDSNPQVIAYVSELLLCEGASDVIRTAVQMKKGRTGVQLSVLCSPDRAKKLQDILFRETSTIGLHYREEQKFILPRSFSTINTRWGPVQIKIATLPGGEVANAAPEFEDCRRIAIEQGIPLKRVMQEAMRAFYEQERAH